MKILNIVIRIFSLLVIVACLVIIIPSSRYFILYRAIGQPVPMEQLVDAINRHGGNAEALLSRGDYRFMVREIPAVVLSILSIEASMMDNIELQQQIAIQYELLDAAFHTIDTVVMTAVVLLVLSIMILLVNLLIVRIRRKRENDYDDDDDDYGDDDIADSYEGDVQDDIEPDYHDDEPGLRKGSRVRTLPKEEKEGDDEAGTEDEDPLADIKARYEKKDKRDKSKRKK